MLQVKFQTKEELDALQAADYMALDVWCDVHGVYKKKLLNQYSQCGDVSPMALLDNFHLGCQKRTRFILES